MSKTSGAAETVETKNREDFPKRVGSFASFEGKERRESLGFAEIVVEDELHIGKSVVESDEDDIAIT